MGEDDGAPVGRVWLSGRGDCMEGEREGDEVVPLGVVRVRVRVGVGVEVGVRVRVRVRVRVTNLGVDHLGERHGDDAVEEHDGEGVDGQRVEEDDHLVRG